MLKNDVRPIPDSATSPLPNETGTTVVTVVDTHQGEKWDKVKHVSPLEDSAGLSYTSDALETPFGVSIKLLKRNMYLFIWLKAVGSFDSGAFSAVLAASKGITQDLDLSKSDQGNLAASVFLGNIIGCPIAGHLFNYYDERKVLNASLVLHTVATFLFALFPGYYYCVFFRFFIGLSLAFIVVYTPVWVDHFAPQDRRSIWMASHNAGVPLGIMLGYLLGLYIPTYTDISWECTFYIKCGLMIPTIVYVSLVDPRSMNARAERVSGTWSDTASSDARVPNKSTPGKAGGAAANTGGENSNHSQGLIAPYIESMKAALHRMKPLILNPVFMCAVLAMSSMYLIATGLQNFVTEYLKEEPFNASEKTIMVGFGAAVVTSPVLGVIVGGILLDRLGGYHGNLLVTSIFATAWGFAAMLFSIICIFVTSTGWFLIIMSCVLFCGGAIIPPGAGLTMSTLPAHLRPTGAAFSQTMYNLLGNYTGPVLCGYIALWTGQLKYGIYTLFLCSILGVIPMSLIVLIAWQRKKKGQAGDGVVITSVEEEMHEAPAEPPSIDIDARQEDREELPVNSVVLSNRRGRSVASVRSVEVHPSRPNTPLQGSEVSRGRTRETFLDMLEGDMAQEKSIPNQHAFGMDLVYSWLSAQAEVEKRHSSTVASRSNLNSQNNRNNNNNNQWESVDSVETKKSKNSRE